MTPNVPLALVKLKLACNDVLEYDGQRAGEIARHGVFVPSHRQRAAGERVRLEIELLDGTCAYSGLAVVVGPEPGAREGYRVVLELPADGGAPTPPPLPTPAATRTPTPPPLRTPTPPPVPVQSLAESLFDDLGSTPPVAPARTPPRGTLRTSLTFGAPPPAPTPTPPPGPPPVLTRTPSAVLGRLKRPGAAAPADDEPELIHLPPPEPEER